MNNFNHESIRLILFNYMNEMINIYSNESHPNFQIEKYYISQMLDDLMDEIATTDVFKYLKEREETLKQTKIYKMIDYMLIDYSC